MSCAVETMSLTGQVRSAVLAAVRRYDPVFADALTGDQEFLSINDCVVAWNAVIDEVDIALGGGQDASSSPFFENPALLDEVLDEMAEFKRAVIAAGGAAVTGW